VALLRTGYRIAYRLISAYSLVRRPRARGVKCVLAHGDRIVLVRHTYGPRRVWNIPGGGLHRGESTLDAARREMREELGLRDVEFHVLGQLELRLAHRRVTIGCAHAELPGTGLDPDPVEIAEARFFEHDALPAPLGDEVRTLVALAFEATATRQRAPVGE
jgi:ADP-ribose pyrophosphatase YjhB (NUDIX family)